MGYMKLTAIFTALSLATFNLYLSYFFRTTDLQFSPISIETANWFFLAKPTLNWGGFFIDGDQPSIHRLPTTLFLVLACGSLISYLRAERTLVEGLSAVILLGGLGGLTLDVLAFGSVSALYVCSHQASQLLVTGDPRCWPVDRPVSGAEWGAIQTGAERCLVGVSAAGRCARCGLLGSWALGSFDR